MRDFFNSINNKNPLVKLSLIIGTSSLFLYGLNRYLFKEIIESSFVHYYLNDILAGMLIVAIVNVLASIGNQHKLMIIRLSQFLIFTGICGLFWEYITPLYLAKSVSDPLDVLAYMAGGIVNWIVIRLFVPNYTENEM